MSARPGEEYVINRAMHLCNPPVSWPEIAQETTWLSLRSKTTSLHKDFVSGELSFNKLFEEIVMATNNSGLDSNYLLVSEKRREREEENGIE